MEKLKGWLVLSMMVGLLPLSSCVDNEEVLPANNTVTPAPDISADETSARVDLNGFYDDLTMLPPIPVGNTLPSRKEQRQPHSAITFTFRPVTRPIRNHIR
jgi:hypothetical protein